MPPRSHLPPLLPAVSLSLSLFASLSTPVRATTYNASDAYSSGALGRGPYDSYETVTGTSAIWNFVLPFNATGEASVDSGLIFMAPRGLNVETPSALIYDQSGNLVWLAASYPLLSSATTGSSSSIANTTAVDVSAQKAYEQTLAYQVQTYKGEQVITIWQGTLNANGYGVGYDLILDQTYSIIANVTAQNITGSGADVHEFQITSNNTALLTAYVPIEYDLTTVGLNSTSWLLDCHAQEVDIETGDLIFDWSASDHVDISESYVSPGTTGTEESTPWDFFHMNSIEKDSSGNYLISSRHLYTLFYVAPNGTILWRMGGMNSSFSMGDGCGFEFQHHARWTNSSTTTELTLFDNGATDWTAPESFARGLKLDVDYSNMSVSLVTQYLPWNKTVSESQGSVQIQPNGNVLVGWGQTPYFAEFDSNNETIWSVQYGVGDVEGYRIFKTNWTGYPTTDPAMVINGSDIYVSWNGATEVATWNLLGSNDGTNITSLLNTTKSGFETVVSIPSGTTYTYYQMAALTSDDVILGYSNFTGTTSGETLGVAAAESASISTFTATSSATGSASSSSSTASASTTSTKSGAERQVAGGIVSAVVAAGALWALL